MAKKKKPPVQKPPWWTEFQLDAKKGIRLRLGSLELLIFRSEREWQIAHEVDRQDQGDRDDWHQERLSNLPPDSPNLERFATGIGGGEVRIEPYLADRSVVARPHIPLHVLPGQETKIYVSSPVWVKITVGDPARVLSELPTRRLSDTWLGASTREGEAGYGLKTYASSGVDEVQIKSYRVVTPVVIRNRAEDLLLVDRMNLPAPYLSIYHSAKNELWTETVTLSHRARLGMAALDLTGGPPSEAGQLTRLTKPRRTIEESRLIRAFGNILKTFGEENSS